MDRSLQKTAVRGFLALLCCALWRSAFPCLKLGYEWLQIENTGSQIFLPDIVFSLQDLTFLAGFIMERRILSMKKSSIPYVLRQGILQTTVQCIYFYYWGSLYGKRQ